MATDTVNVPMERPSWPQAPMDQHAELRRIVAATFAADAEMVGLVRVVAVRDGDTGSWNTLFGRIDICHKGDAKFGPRFSYRNARTLSWQVSGAALVAMIDALTLGEHPFACDDITLPPLGPAPRLDPERYASNGAYADWPCLYLNRSLPAASVSGTYGPLASADDAPYFSDIWGLVGHVADFGLFHGSSDARRNTFAIVIWDYSARFAGATVSRENALMLSLEGRDLEGSALRGQFVGAEGIEQIRRDASASVEITPVTQAQYADLVLVDATHRIVDRMTVPWHAAEKPGRTRVQSPEDVVAHCLGQGECDQIEFKPYVDLDGQDNKWSEIFETALAMSNARGGSILVGVDNHARPAFGSRDRRAVFRKEAAAASAASPEERNAAVESALAQYANALRDRIEQHVNKSLRLRYLVAWIGVNPVLLLTISAGTEPPYMDRRNNSVWYRTNATNRLASEEELATIFANRSR